MICFLLGAETAAALLCLWRQRWTSRLERGLVITGTVPANPSAERARIEALVSMVFGSGTRPDAKPWSLLRYQLLTAVAGTAIEAAHRKSDTAVLIIHEFITHSADPAKVADNGRDLSDFVSVLFSEGADPMQPGRLNGPAVLAADKNLPRAVNVFIGKAVFSWRNNDGPDNPTN